MQCLWGSLIAVIGLFMFICGHRKSGFVIYRLLVARSKILWGDNVYRFHQVAGIVMFVFGVLLALEFILMK